MAANGDPHADDALNLALAIVAESSAPLVLLAGDLSVVAASTSFCDAFQIDHATTRGKDICSLGAGEWNLPQFRTLLLATASGAAHIDAYEMDLKRADGVHRLVVNAKVLRYGASKATRMLLSIADITDAVNKERHNKDLLNEKAILLQEVQHRVANSLQIIASVLIQSARKVQSEEIRSHLRNAHHRVMSIASVQQQLADSGREAVVLRDYLTTLCESLGASMIFDDKEMSIEVNVDDTVTSSDISVSLGLMVTELVINALKHAFPDGGVGKVVVTYRSAGIGWSLSVVDNGKGMPAAGQPLKAGLGTSIVQALAAQLHAVVTITDAKPGVAVTIAQERPAA